MLGGGLVAGGVVLIGGDPGIGKSTLLLQALANLSRVKRVLYVSGEESGAQIALRAKRLAVDALANAIGPVFQASPDPAAFSELATEQPLSSTPVPRAAADRDTSRRGRPDFGAMVVAAGRGRSNVMVSSGYGNRAVAGLDGLRGGCPAAGRMDSVGPAHTAVKEPDGRDGAPDGRGGAVRCGRRM